MSQDMLNHNQKKLQSEPSGDFIVNQIKRLIKSEFSTDDEGVLQFNKNGYQASIKDVIASIDDWYNKSKR